MSTPSKLVSLIYPASSHVEPKNGRYDRLAPMVCSVLWVKPDQISRWFFFRGAERSTLTMLARGIAEVVTETQFHIGKHQILCVTPTDGLWQMTRISENSAHVTEDLAVYAQLSAMLADRKLTPRSSTGADTLAIDQTARMARKIRPEVLADYRADPERFRRPGITWRGYGEVHQHAS